MTPDQPSALDAERMAALFDHTALRPETTEAQIRQLCAEARHYGFAGVCINPTWVALAAELLAERPVKVCTVIGFPLGATLTDVKQFETRTVLAAGANEVDMVLNIGRLKGGDMRAVQADMAAVVETVRAFADTTHTEDAAGAGQPVLVKVILETVLLTDDEKRTACRLAQAAGADFVKTSTGFASGGATVADVQLMRTTVGAAMGVKASGGIRTAADAQAMVRAGANRLGTSATVAIMQELLAQDGEHEGDA